MKNRNLISSLLVLLTPIFLYGQSVLGVVTDTEGNPLAGANVVVEDTDKGGVTDNTGKYTIDVGASGDYDLTASYIGYSRVTNTVTVNDIVGTVNFVLEVDAVTLSALEVLASRADETTPVAYTTVSKEELEVDLVHKTFRWHLILLQVYTQLNKVVVRVMLVSMFVASTKGMLQ